ncbi:MAG: hypothetical protein JRS35_16390 [Deltaproteobacteria bacterium]|nr:hypothetical protein [Deltaproteobacteria bacterium]
MGNGENRLQRFDRLTLLRLSGSGYQMGLQHGSLLREPIRQGVVPRFGRYTEFAHLLRVLAPEQRRAIQEQLDRQIFDRLERFVPEAYRDELRGIADGSGLDYGLVYRGNFLSELGQITAGRGGPATLEATGGCTGFVVGGPATADGRLLHGKNTDYLGVGVWDRHPTLVFCRPDDGYAYVKVSSAGLIKCNSCMNEHGITLGGHILFSSDTSQEGVAFTVFENEVMRRARSLAEAIAIIEEQPRAGAFAFLVSDHKAGEAVALECSRSEVGKRPLEAGALVMSNMCSASASQVGNDLLLRGGVARNPISRFRRMTQMIDEQHGRIDLAQAAAFLGDHFDPASGRERGVGHTIASIASVTSVVFVPELRQVWIGLGPAPAANNRFIGFGCTPELEGSGPAVALGELEGNAFSNDRCMQAVARYGAASLAYDEHTEDPDAVIALLEEARGIDPAEPNYCRMLARFELRRGAAAAAERALAQAAEISGQSRAEEAENALLQGYACDLQQRRPEAEECYRRVLGLREEGAEPLYALNPLVLHSAEKRLSTPFQKGDVDATTVSFSFQSGWE